MEKQHRITIFFASRSKLKFRWSRVRIDPRFLLCLLLPFERSLATSSQTFHLSIHQYSSSLRLSKYLAESGTVTKSPGTFFVALSIRIAKRTAKGHNSLPFRIRFTRSLCMLRHSSQTTFHANRSKRGSFVVDLKKKKQKKSTKIIFIYLLCSAWMALLFLSFIHTHTHSCARTQTENRMHTRVVVDMRV